MEWFRWYHGATSDPKWPLIARKAGVSVGVVVSVWAALLEHASQDEERGSVADFDGETFDALYGYDDGTCAAVVDAMREKGLLCDGCICSWRKRQPLRERDDSSTERVREHRNKKRQETPHDTDETPCNASETPRNAQIRTEKIREEDIRTPLTPHGGEGECVTSAPARKAKQPTAYSPDFEHFWQLYPHKIGKDAAWKIYQRRKHEIPTGENMAAILARHAQTEKWQRDGGRYIPHPATWLSQGRWADDVTPVVGIASRETPPSPEAQKAMEEILRERTPEELERNRQSSQKYRQEWLRKRGIDECLSAQG